MTDRHGPPGLVLPAVLRYWRVVLALTAGVGLVAALALAGLDVRTYQRTATYLVAPLPSSGSDAALVGPNTDRAARDYAAVLQQDEQLLSQLGLRVGRDADEVRERLQAGYEPAASAIRVRYSGTSAEEVEVLFAELDRLVATDGVPSAGFAPGSVRPLSSSGEVVALSDPFRRHPSSGLLLGLAAGVTAAVALERARPRVGGRRHLQWLTRRPVVEVPPSSDEALEALVVRLLAPIPEPRRVLAVASEPSGDGAAHALADRVRDRTASLARAGVLAGGAATATVEHVPHDVLHAAEGRAAAVVWLLVVPPGSPVRAVGAALDRLSASGPVVVAVVPPAEPAEAAPLPVPAGVSGVRPAPVQNRAYFHRVTPATPPPGVVMALVLAGTALAGATAVVHPLAPLFLAAAGAGVALAWQRPLVAAVAVVAVVPALSGLERGLGVPFLKASEVLLLLSLAVVLLRRPAMDQRFRSVDWALLAFAVGGVVFGALHVLSGVSEPGTFVRVGLGPTMLFMTWWVASRATRDADDLRVVLRWMLLISTVPAALAVLQAFDLPGARSLLNRLVGGPLLADPGQPGVIRVTGPFPIWHSLAAYLVPAVTVTVALLLRGVRERFGRPVLSRPVLLAVLLVDVAALVLSVTITVIGWAVVAVLILAFLQRRLAQAVALLVVAGVASSVLFAAPLAARVEAQFAPRASTSNEVPQTLAYRVEVWQRDFVPLLERAVPYGIGNELPQSVLFQNTENQYISLVLRGGLLLLLAGLVSMILAAAAVARVARRPAELTGAVAGAALGVVLFLPVASMIWPYLTNAGFPQAWLSLAGAVVGAAAGAGRRPVA